MENVAFSVLSTCFHVSRQLSDLSDKPRFERPINFDEYCNLKGC